MGISSCCGAPIVVKYQSDPTHFSDDDYELKIPVQVCSVCGAIIAGKSKSQSSTESGSDNA